MQEEKLTLDAMLEKAGIHRADLARRMGVTPRQVSRWNTEMPKYVVSYLDLLIRLRELGHDA